MHEHWCGFCHQKIIDGLFWVREKTPGTGRENIPAAYTYYHAEPFSNEIESCFEKHLSIKLRGAA